MLFKIKLLDSILHNFLAPIIRDSLDLRVEPKMLFNSHEWEHSIMLGAVSDKLASLSELLQDIVTCNGDLTISWHNVSRKTLECR